MLKNNILTILFVVILILVFLYNILITIKSIVIYSVWLPVNATSNLNPRLNVHKDPNLLRKSWMKMWSFVFVFILSEEDIK